MLASSVFPPLKNIIFINLCSSLTLALFFVFFPLVLPFSGMVSGGGTNVSMHGVRGPFTPSQWLELEHQALIYKFIDAKAPIPSNLLIPFRRSIISPSGLSAYFPGSPYRSTTCKHSSLACFIYLFIYFFGNLVDSSFLFPHYFGFGLNLSCFSLSSHCLSSDVDFSSLN